MAKDWLSKTAWRTVWLIDTWDTDPKGTIIHRYCNVIPSGTLLRYGSNTYSLENFKVRQDKTNTYVLFKPSPGSEFLENLGMTLTNVEESALDTGRVSTNRDSDAILFTAEYTVVDRTYVKTGDIQLILSPYYKEPKVPKSYHRCPWVYRSPRRNNEGCGYSGSNYWNVNNDGVLNRSSDVCNKSIEACNLRFPKENMQPFSGSEIWD